MQVPYVKTTGYGPKMSPVYPSGFSLKYSAFTGLRSGSVGQMVKKCTIAQTS